MLLLRWRFYFLHPPFRGSISRRLRIASKIPFADADALTLADDPLGNSGKQASSEELQLRPILGTDVGAGAVANLEHAHDTLSLALVRMNDTTYA